MMRKKGHGDAGSPILSIKSRFPGVSRTAISVFRVPRLTRSWLSALSAAELRPQPANRRTGRIAGRAGHSPSHLFRAGRFRRRRVSVKAAFAKTSRGARIGNRTPRAPLPARKPGTDLPDLPFVGREREEYRNVFKRMSTEFCIKPGLFSCGRVQARVRYCRG
jgi:hypothetical protein